MAPSSVVVPNLVDPKSYLDHDMPEVWRVLRAQDPVHRHPETSEGPGFWVVSRYEDIARVLRDDGNFTSEKGNVLATMLKGGDMGARSMLAVSDGNYHTSLRKLLLEAFSPRAVAGVERHVRRIARQLMVEAIEKGECDFARDIASAIPLETICGLLDIPRGDRQEVAKLTKSALASDYENPEAHADVAARSALVVYFQNLVAERRKTPGADPISLMATAQVDGRRLTDLDIVLNCYSLIMGGDETSRLAMIGAVRAFVQNPDQWRAFKARDASVEVAGEEVLRWTTPAMHFGRTATADVSLRDRTIRAGDLVTLWLISGNRDEAVFQDPERFDITRSPNRHLALGHGRHFCLGAYLGRIEIRAMLDGLRAFVGGIRQAGPERWIYSNFLTGMSSLPVVLERDPAPAVGWEE
ncbi:cytochrome P450 [Streptomyces sp. SLBN-8D4]|jgi:cytochrome P450|uniref:cytochrome P450 n=1 Tax=Streptomyces sp. SLBN-8D4 TaxID=3377728 RepID=UPI003C7AF7DD